MKSADFSKWASNIRVILQENEDVEVVNNSPLALIGKGRQGAVFDISEEACMKVYGDPEDCDREYYAMSKGQHTSLLPHVYAKDKNLIVMEKVTGVDLREYLQSQPLTPELSWKLIEMLVTFKEIGFERIDHHKRQIYLQPDGSLKVIDVGRAVWRDRVYPYPRKLLNSLGAEYRHVFLSHVQQMAPELYEEWQYYINAEDQARSILQRISETPLKLDEHLVKKASRVLSTKPGKKGDTIPLENLVYKVLKEQLERSTRDRTDRSRTAKKALRKKKEVTAQNNLWRNEMKIKEADLARKEEALASREHHAKSEQERATLRHLGTQLREQKHRLRRERHGTRAKRHK